MTHQFLNKFEDSDKKNKLPYYKVKKLALHLNLLLPILLGFGMFSAGDLEGVLGSEIELILGCSIGVELRSSDVESVGKSFTKSSNDSITTGGLKD